MEEEHTNKRYSIPRKDFVTVGVSRNVRNAIRVYAINRNSSMTESVYLLIRIGLEFEMLRKELKHKQFLELVATLLRKYREKNKTDKTQIT